MPNFKPAESLQGRNLNSNIGSLLWFGETVKTWNVEGLKMKCFMYSVPQDDGKQSWGCWSVPSGHREQACGQLMFLWHGILRVLGKSLLWTAAVLHLKSITCLDA